MKTTAILTLAALCALPSLASAAEVTGKLDPDHSSANFTVTHLTIAKVHGTIAIKDATIVLGDGHTLKSADATLDLTMIDTHQSQRDSDLRSQRWFDVADHPVMTFKSTSVRPGPNGTTLVTGDLTIRGITKSVSLTATYNGTVTDPRGRTHDGFSAIGTVDRTGWNLGATFPPVVVGSDVTIDLELDVIEQ
jgi:polyisoprenoid-binding protein YceI